MLELKSIAANQFLISIPNQLKTNILKIFTYEAQRLRPAPRSWAVSLVPKKTAHRVGRYAVRAGPPLSAEGPSDKGS